MIPADQAWDAYRQRRKAPLKPKKSVRDGIEAALSRNAFEVLTSGETPDGDTVALVGISEKAVTVPVIVLVVGNEITHIWEATESAEAVAVFQKVVVLGPGK